MVKSSYEYIHCGVQCELCYIYIINSVWGSLHGLMGKEINQLEAELVTSRCQCSPQTALLLSEGNNEP